MLERHEITDRATWLARRSTDVTASVVGALFDAHPYSTALRLYAQHRGVDFPEPTDNVLRRGRWLEPAVAAAVSEARPDWTIEKANAYFRDGDLRLGATPDFFIHGDPRGLGVLQTKTVAPSVFRRDWDEGRIVPLWVNLQALTECMLTGAMFGAAAALLVDAHAMDIAIHEIPRHPGAEARIADAVREFWRHVDLGQEPAPDFARDAEVIRALKPTETKGKAIDLSAHNSIREMLAQRSFLMARIKDSETRCSEIESEIRFLLGDAEFAIGLPGWSITYRSGTRSGYTVPTKTMRTLRVLDKRPPEERPVGASDD